MGKYCEKYQDVELENDCSVSLVCDWYSDEDGVDITNVRFAKDYVVLYGVEASIKSLPSIVVKHMLDYAENKADDMGWVL